MLRSYTAVSWSGSPPNRLDQKPSSRGAVVVVMVMGACRMRMHADSALWHASLDQVGGGELGMGVSVVDGDDGFIGHGMYFRLVVLFGQPDGCPSFHLPVGVRVTETCLVAKRHGLGMAVGYVDTAEVDFLAKDKPTGDDDLLLHNRQNCHVTFLPHRRNFIHDPSYSDPLHDHLLASKFFVDCNLARTGRPDCFDRRLGNPLGHCGCLSVQRERLSVIRGDGLPARRPLFPQDGSWP